MKIILYLEETFYTFFLPIQVSGNFVFDYQEEEEDKLINVKAKDNCWYLYSTEEVMLLENGIAKEEIELKHYHFYKLKRNNILYNIYIEPIYDETFQMFSYNNQSNLMIGKNNACNIIYQNEKVGNHFFHIFFENNKAFLETNPESFLYLNFKRRKESKVFLKNGDVVEFYGFRLILYPGFLLMNNPLNQIFVNENAAKIFHIQCNLDKNLDTKEIKEIELYQEKDYFSKSPRIRRMIEKKEIDLDAPPKENNGQKLPLIFTLGPMMSMGIVSGVMLVNTVLKLSSGETTFKDSWPQLVTGSAMLLTTVLWPLVTNLYNKKLAKKEHERLIKLYTEYLKEKSKELENEKVLQTAILKENLITLSECLEIVRLKKFNLWDKRIDQNDFLTARIGIGKVPLQVKINYPKDGFTIEESELKKMADQLVEQFQYIENVPVSYSFFDNSMTAIMGNPTSQFSFVDNLLLQFMTFYSYDDVKFVFFGEKDHWEYLKYSSHCLNDSKTMRFYATDMEESKYVSEYLLNELTIRKSQGKNFSKKPYYLILVDNYTMVKKIDFFKQIVELDENYGFSLIFIEEHLSKLPSKCSNFIILGNKSESGLLKNSYEKQEVITFQDEIVYDIDMLSVCKTLSNIPIEVTSEMAKLPEVISFLEMEKVGKVEQLNILNRWNTNDSTKTLKAEVGVDQNGELMYLDLHEKFHGPHGLIAGMTGSGKSEFIITFILSLAINYSPDDVAFILIDYKGGGLAGAFENKALNICLPHVAGVITNLDKAELSRTLVSIDSEVKRRQKVFNEARDSLGQSTIDIYKYQKFYHEGKLSEPVPHLVIVCDEFAELKSQQPEFMDNLISIARIGRSLGVHLILATQKPSGVVNDQIWSNTKFRVCLKVQDVSDSKEMLKRPEAASLKQTGRFYLQVGYDEYFELGQSAWCGAKYFPSDKIVKKIDRSINFINDSGQIIKSIQAKTEDKKEAQGEQLLATLKSIIEIANQTNKKAKRLWLENIPPIILIDSLHEKYKNIENPSEVTAILGEYDAPEIQSQGEVTYHFLEDGNTIIYGNDGSENENLLNAILYSTLKYYSAEDINYYFIDFGSETLRRYRNAPHVGDMVFNGEEDKYNNLFKLIKEEMEYRKKLFIDYGGEYRNYRKNNDKKIPLFVVIINNYDSVYENNEKIFETLPELVRDSERYGIIYIITASGSNSVHSKIAQNCKNFYAFKLKNVSDYSSIFSLNTKMYPRDTFGRGLIKNNGIHEFQTASIVQEMDQLNDYIYEFLKELNQRETYRAKRIPILPSIIRFSDIKEQLRSFKNIPIGMVKKDLEIVKYDFTQDLFTIITSTKLGNINSFMLSLLSLFTMFDKVKLILVDPQSLLQGMREKTLFYVNKNFQDNLQNMNQFLDEQLAKEEKEYIIIVFYGINKFLSKLENKTQFTSLVDKAKKYENIFFLLSDDVLKIKPYLFEPWYSQNVNASNGFWIGRGITEQSVLKVGTINKEMQKDYKNDMGYCMQDGRPMLVKYIDFVHQEKEEENEK